MKKNGKPLVIALIGGIASGKSTIAKAFESIGGQVIDADILAKTLYLPGTELYKKILEHFGSRIVTPSLEVNRSLLKKIIIESPQEKAWLETQIHPLVRMAIHQAIQACAAPLCVLEIPLLKDKAHYPEIDYILLARCAPQEQLKRLMKRSTLNEQEAKSLIQLGIPSQLQEQLANCVIDTTTLREQDLMDWVNHFVSERLSQA